MILIDTDHLSHPIAEYGRPGTGSAPPAVMPALCA